MMPETATAQMTAPRDDSRSASRIAGIYALCAIVAMAANILAQDITGRIYNGPFAVPAAIAIGTLVGLAVKYELDKRFIFRFRPANRRQDGCTFLLYSLMGLATTAIFWGTELAFHYAFDDKFWRYVGAVVGLTIGYVVKYELDRRFVFRTT